MTEKRTWKIRYRREFDIAKDRDIGAGGIGKVFTFDAPASWGYGDVCEHIEARPEMADCIVLDAWRETAK